MNPKLTSHFMAPAALPLPPFAMDVARGLTASPKTLPSKYFYNELGSLLFEAICHLDEYYPTRCEAAILREYATEIVSQQPRRQRLVELGSGSSVKTRYLLEALLARQRTLAYHPIDISESILAQTVRVLEHDYPNLQAHGQARDYTTGIGDLERDSDEALLVLFLGSNIGNYDPVAARGLLRELRHSLQPGDMLLLGADLIKDASILESAYDDALGVTAAFNLNLLSRINHELGGDFKLCQFRHRAVYNDEYQRVEMHLFSRIRQTVSISSLHLRVSFRGGESIHTENSHKFDRLSLAQLAADGGFEPVKSWTDHAGNFSSNLWRAN
ncbi:MAG: L-histidine N(alpha)-methyltransferase [Blastocatellia bacterium]